MASSLFCRSAGLYRDNSTASSASATAANKHQQQQQQLPRTLNINPPLLPPSPSPSPSPSPHFNDFLGYAPLPLSSSPASDLSSLRSVFQGPDPTAARFHDPPPFDNHSESSSFSSFMSSISDDNEEDGDEAESSIFDSSSSSPSSALSSSTTPPSPSLSSESSSPGTLHSASFPPEQQNGPLDTIESLASALPIKRGLSCYFSGKSQSFSCLSAISTVADLAKPEDPFAKKRRMSAHMAKKQNRSHPSRCASSGAISKRSASHSSIGINHSQTKSSRYQHHHQHHYLKPLPSSKCFSVSELQDAAAAAAAY